MAATRGPQGDSMPCNTPGRRRGFATPELDLTESLQILFAGGDSLRLSYIQAECKYTMGVWEQAPTLPCPLNPTHIEGYIYRSSFYKSASQQLLGQVRYFVVPEPARITSNLGHQSILMLRIQQGKHCCFSREQRLQNQVTVGILGLDLLDSASVSLVI